MISSQHRIGNRGRRGLLTTFRPDAAATQVPGDWQADRPQTELFY